MTVATSAEAVECLRLQGIEKSFGPVRALRGVSFSVRAGEVHALLGENGAGKSTLIKVVTGAHAPDAGTLTLGGQTWRELTPALAHSLGVACIYQQPALFPDLTIAENLGLRLAPPRVWGRRRRRHWGERAAVLLGRLGLTIDPETEVRELSMPEQQLVEVACALGAGARWVIMDEPTASLTRREQELLFAVVRELRGHGVGVIYISHRIEEIFALADRVTVLRDGESVGSWDVGAITEAELIRQMVGRELTSIYPSREGCEVGEVVLQLEEFGCRALGLAGVNLTVRAGEIVGLAGLVGAGRTELACSVFGLAPSDCGVLRIEGREVRVTTPREAVAAGIAYVPEDRRRHGVIGEMSLAHNVSLALHRRLFPWGWLRRSAEARLARHWMDALEIKAPEEATAVSALSGGNQQKVALARWLATEPKLLILDEPTQGIDVGAKAEVHRRVRECARRGLAVLLLSSDLPEVLGLSDRIGVMRGGRLVATLAAGEATPATVMAAALGRGESMAAGPFVGAAREGKR